MASTIIGMVAHTYTARRIAPTLSEKAYPIRSTAPIVPRFFETCQTSVSHSKAPAEVFSTKCSVRPGRVSSVFGLLSVLLIVAMTCTTPSLCAAETRGGRVGWARLITSHPQWAIHSNQDPQLARFIRSETTLNIDPVWYTVDSSDLEKLCAYPYVYAKDLTRLTQTHDLENIREYFRRGGFLCIDPCTSGLDLEAFRREHVAWFSRLFPKSTVRELPDTHEFFRCYFSVTVDDLFTPDMIRRGATKPSQIGMRGVFLDDRMIAVISLSGLECGWPQTPQRVPGCMKMIVNSYVYAMTR